jgi:hypothetical protein
VLTTLTDEFADKLGGGLRIEIAMIAVQEILWPVIEPTTTAESAI